MAALQELNVRQISEALHMACQRQIPAAATMCCGDSWRSLRTRLLMIRNRKLLIELPANEEGESPQEFSPGDQIGVTFKLKHYKHVMPTRVEGLVQIELDDGTTMPVLAVALPSRMQRLQRRAFFRVDVPPGRIVRAAVWLGGQNNEPSGMTPSSPVWSGRIVNLSAGGFQLACGPEAVDLLEVGDTVGVRLSFGPAEETVYADAQFRHAEIKDGTAMIGFQFIGLAQSAAGKQSLQAISRRVSEFQRIQQHAAG